MGQCHALAVSGREVLGGIVVVKVDADGVDRAGECIVHREVVIGDRGSTVDADVERLVEGEVVGGGLLDPAFAGDPAISGEPDFRALADAAAVVLEFQGQFLGSRDQRFVRPDAVEVPPITVPSASLSAQGSGGFVQAERTEGLRHELAPRKYSVALVCS